jgi:hypothetical protein
MDPQDEALLDFVNGKGTADTMLVLILAGYLVLSSSAISKLQELKGAVHAWNPENEQKT